MLKPQPPADAEIRPVDQPYDPALDAQAALDAAFARAAGRGTRVLVVFGGSWCPDCRIFAGMLAVPEIAAFLAQAYEPVGIDVGRYDRNLDAVARMGFPQGLEGVPTVLVATADGRLVNRSLAAHWRTARQRTLAEAADYLHLFAAAEPPVDSTRVSIRAS